jgi:hypothetical protein
MPDETRVYKGRELRVKTPEGEPSAAAEAARDAREAAGLYIDGEYIVSTYTDATGRYWNYQLPYLDYPSLIELGEALIDHVYGGVEEGEPSSSTSERS